MQIGSNILYNTGSNYSTQANENSISKETEKKVDKEVEKKESEKSKPDNELSQDEKVLLNKLQARDSEVRSHESAHQSGGASTGGASYTYQQGPDGKMYAIGGEVSVSMPSGSTPEETIQNAQAVIAAAMAPSDPSGQDFAVASSARIMMMKAQQQKTKDMQEKMLGQETYKNESSKDMNKKEDSNNIDFPA